MLWSSVVSFLRRPKCYQNLYKVKLQRYFLFTSQHTTHQHTTVVYPSWHLLYFVWLKVFQNTFPSLEVNTRGKQAHGRAVTHASDTRRAPDTRPPECCWSRQELKYIHLAFCGTYNDSCYEVSFKKYWMAWLCEDCLKQMSPCINSLSRGKGSLDCSRLSFPFSPDATAGRLSLSELLTTHASYLLIFHVAASCSVLHGNSFLFLLNLIRLLTCPLCMHAC